MKKETVRTRRFLGRKRFWPCIMMFFQQWNYKKYFKRLVVEQQELAIGLMSPFNFISRENSFIVCKQVSVYFFFSSKEFLAYIKIQQCSRLVWKNNLRICIAWSLWDISTEVLRVVLKGLGTLVICWHLCQTSILCAVAGNKCYSSRCQKKSLQSQNNDSVWHFGNPSRPIQEKWRQTITGNEEETDTWV